MALSPQHKNRALIQTFRPEGPGGVVMGIKDQITGWITWYDLKPNIGLELYARPMTGQLTQTPNQRNQEMRMSTAKRTKIALEAARDGNVAQLRMVMGDPMTWGHELQKLQGYISPNAHDTRARTVLMYACGYGQVKCAEFLMAHPMLDINRLDDTEKSVLHHACRKTVQLIGLNSQDGLQATLVKMLAARGALVDLKDYNGVTPLMVAVEVRDRRITDMLLFLGAHRNQKDYEGKTAMDRARANWDLKMGLLLRNAGAKYDEFGDWHDALDTYEDDGENALLIFLGK